MKAKFVALTLMIVSFLLAAPLAHPGYADDGSILESETPTLTYTVSVTPTSEAKSGQPGMIINYNLTIENTGNQDLNLTITQYNSAEWKVQYNPSALTLAAGAKAQLAVSVTIPANAQAGQLSQTVMKIEGEGGALASATLTTTALTPSAPGRPLIGLESYSVGASGAIQPGQRFDLRLRVVNRGDGFARDLVFTFSGAEFLPLDTGGVITHNEMDPGEKVEFSQPLLASSTLTGQKVATTAVAVSYTDMDGAPYTANFTITINLSQPSSSGVSRPTATPTQVSRPQLVVSGYGSDVDPLQPGTVFSLNLDIRNLGTSDARSVTMVLGGGASAGESGTPAPGISGSGADTSVFAPLGASNLVYLGDVPVGVTVQSSQQLIVNTSANPGAYAFKISFVYDDAKGARQVNDQIITLLIYQLPQLEINYYRDPGMFMLGQPNMLPLQVTNLGRKQTVLGNLKVTSPNADVTNNVTLVGILDPGGYYTLDANVVPMQPGPLELQVEVNYTDDFNQQRTINQTLVVDVVDMPTPEPFPPEGFPPEGGEMPPAVEQSVWDKFLRFIKGLLGLGSQEQTPEQPPIIIPEGEVPGVKPGVIINPPKG